MSKHYVVVSERDNRVVCGPVTKKVAEAEHKRLSQEAAELAPTHINRPTDEQVAERPELAAMRDAEPAPPESYKVLEYESTEDVRAEPLEEIT